MASRLVEVEIRIADKLRTLGDEEKALGALLERAEVGGAWDTQVAGQHRRRLAMVREQIQGFVPDAVRTYRRLAVESAAIEQDLARLRASLEHVRSDLARGTLDRALGADQARELQQRYEETFAAAQARRREREVLRDFVPAVEMTGT